MAIDYVLEMIEELGRAMRAIIARRKDQPAKALEEIRAAFNGTKFGNKAFFDGLSAEELAVFLREREVDYRAADYMVDILLEEAEMRRDEVLERLAMEGDSEGSEGQGRERGEGQGREGSEGQGREGSEGEGREWSEGQGKEQNDGFGKEGDPNPEIRLIVDSPEQLLLLAKIQVMIDYTSETEASLKIYSLKRGTQKERLKGLS